MSCRERLWFFCQAKNWFYPAGDCPAPGRPADFYRYLHRWIYSATPSRRLPNQRPPALLVDDDPDANDDHDPDKLRDGSGEEALVSRTEPADALKAARRKTHQLERLRRTIKCQLAQFSKTNPDWAA